VQFARERSNIAKKGGRGAQIRTGDLMYPKHARYQAALRPVTMGQTDTPADAIGKAPDLKKLSECDTIAKIIRKKHELSDPLPLYPDDPPHRRQFPEPLQLARAM
jgi:hypothetical protein